MKLGDIPKLELSDISNLTHHVVIPTNELLEVPFGSQHNSMRTIMNRLLSTSDPETWETTIKNQVYTAAQNYNPPFNQEKLDKLWTDCKSFIREKRLEKKQPLSIQQVAQLRLINRELESKAPSTGFEKLDRLIKGFVPNHLYVLTGHTNIGKTSVSANFAYNVAAQGKRVLYFALEPADTVIEYLISVKDRKPFSQICMADLTKDLPNVDVYTKDQIGTLQQMVSAIKSLPRYDLIIVDHIGYFIRGDKTDTVTEQSNAIKEIVQLAKQQQTSLLLVAHVNKQTGLIPTMNDISGSGAFKQDATDVLIVIRSKDETSSTEIDQFLDEGFIIVAKNKGPMGRVRIKFQDSSAYVTDGTRERNHSEEITEKLIRETLF